MSQINYAELGNIYAELNSETSEFSREFSDHIYAELGNIYAELNSETSEFSREFSGAGPRCGL